METKTINAENIFEKGLLISLTMGTFAGRKKMSEEQLAGLPTDIVRGVHDMFDKDFKDMLKGIVAQENETRGSLKRKSVPFPIDGVYFIMSDKIQPTIDFLNEKKVERDALVAAAADNYEEAKERFAKEYPEYYKAAQSKYPSKEQFVTKFPFRYQLFTVAKPNKDLEFISPELYASEMKKFKEDVDNMKKEVINVIATELLEKTKRLYAQCSADGRPNQRTLNNLGKFFETVEEVYSGFVERKDIKKLIEMVKKQTTGVEADALRDDEDFKSKFQKEMKKAVDTIKALPDVELTRAIDF
jgi:hypothetical protein